MHTCSVLVLVERAAGMSDATSHISHALRVLLPFLVLPAPPRNRCAPSSARCSGVATSRASVSRALGNKNGQGQQWPHSRRPHAHAPQRAPARRAKDFLWTRSPVHARIMGTTAAVARSRATFTTTHAATTAEPVNNTCLIMCLLCGLHASHLLVEAAVAPRMRGLHARWAPVRKSAGVGRFSRALRTRALCVDGG